MASDDSASTTPAPTELPTTDGSLWATLSSADWVFADRAVRSYELELSDADWEHLRAHALDEEYLPAILRVDGIEVGQVGLRYKGSFGTLNRCARNGRLLCNKLSMKVRFDEYQPEQRFFGLKRLHFNSMLSDPSHLRERLAYRMFREMGVAAPRAGHATLTVNGESLGVFSLVEDIDGRFTDHRFERGDGNLYKERWPNSRDSAHLSGGLETNDEAPNHDALIAFQQELTAATAEELHAVVARRMNVDELYAYVAVDRAIANYDGMTAFYCRGRCTNHNYYFYQHEDEGRFSLIPWDLDATFSVANAFDYVPPTLVIPSSCSRRFPVFGDMKVLAPACDPLIQGLARGDLARYHEQQARLLEGPFELGALEEWIDERVAQLSPLVLADDNGPGYTLFLRGVDELRHNLSLLAERLRVERDGQQIVRSRLVVGGKNDFESATPVGVRFGLLARSSLDSRFDLQVSERGALAGARDLSLSFELRDAAAEPPWVRFALPFDDPDPIDLNGVTSVRLVLQADAPRTIRVGIGSSGYSQYLPRSVLGWDIAADGTRQELELALRDATFPRHAAPVPESPAEVLRYANELSIDPAATGVDAGGYLGAGKSQRGWVRVDQIEFVR